MTVIHRENYKRKYNGSTERYYVLHDNKIVGIKYGRPEYVLRQLSTGVLETFQKIDKKTVKIRRQQ